MPTEGDGGDDRSKTQSVQEQVQGAMTAMQDNMRAMAERDSQLHNIEARTNDLQGATKSFSSGAKRLKRHYDWQRYKLYIIVGGSILWVLTCFFIPKEHFWPFLAISLVLVAIAAGINALLSRREKLREEAEEESQANTAELGEALSGQPPLE
eukprot:TRINITY_DN30200_c0_g1_i1.p1 TRINITY_DN30200_c0_g1~~TRINITY_DN30200_c0_g1_i1.p1  ORF type:complete len:153 (+),score=43.66 TRINITY_DN30200_c0_g1_i1:62-520(+)